MDVRVGRLLVVEASLTVGVAVIEGKGRSAPRATAVAVVATRPLLDWVIVASPSKMTRTFHVFLQLDQLSVAAALSWVLGLLRGQVIRHLLLALDHHHPQVVPVHRPPHLVPEVLLELRVHRGGVGGRRRCPGYGGRPFVGNWRLVQTMMHSLLTSLTVGTVAEIRYY